MNLNTRQGSVWLCVLAALGMLLMSLTWGCQSDVAPADGNSSVVNSPDEATGTLLVGDETVDVGVTASWTVFTDTDCGSGVRGILYVEFQELGVEGQRTGGVAVPFDGTNLPAMPLDMATYQFGCRPDLTNPVSFGLSPPPHTPDVNYNVVQGTINLSAERTGDVVHVHGDFDNVLVMTRDGQHSLTLSGTFDEDGMFEDGTMDKMFTP